MDLAWYGRAGEQIQLTRNGGKVLPPEVQISDAQGAFKTNQRFGTSCPGGVCTLHWERPCDWSEDPAFVTLLTGAMPFEVERETITD